MRPLQALQSYLMTQSKLKNYLSRSDIQNTYKKAINSQSKAFEFKVKELVKISPSNLVILHDYVLNKHKEQGEDSLTEWSQSEKKVVNWLLLCYLQTNSKTVSQLDDQDYHFLSEITTNKPVELIKYHVQSSLKQTKRPKWTENEDHILYQIMAVQKKYPPVGEWIHVSKELFLRGDQESYKSGKNCRERWFNHVDPAIEKTWTIQQDLILLNHVKTKGKKWSSIIPVLNHTKSEHMIKNRFNSLLRRKGESSKRESSLVDILIDELKQQLAQEMEKRRKDVKIVVKIDESQKKRILRSSSIKQQKEEPNMELLNSNVGMNMTDNTNISQLIGGEPKKSDQTMILDFIREEPGHEEVKHTKEFNPYQSIKFCMSSPLPPTPGPTGLLSSSLLSTPFGHEHQYNFSSLCQKFKSTLNE